MKSDKNLSNLQKQQIDTDKVKGGTKKEWEVLSVETRYEETPSGAVEEKPASNELNTRDFIFKSFYKKNRQ